MFTLPFGLQVLLPRTVRVGLKYEISEFIILLLKYSTVPTHSWVWWISCTYFEPCHSVPLCTVHCYKLWKLFNKKKKKTKLTFRMRYCKKSLQHLKKIGWNLIFTVVKSFSMVTAGIPNKHAFAIFLGQSFHIMNLLIHLFFKGTVSRDFCSRFFPQTAPPGPIRDVLGPFWFFVLLGWDLSILKWLPGAWDTGELPQKPCDRKNFQTCFNCICIVNANIRQFFEWLLL